MASCWVCLFFFFSSRRRHTRLQGDWSSDVCSSDLLLVPCHLASLPSQQSSSQVIPSQGAPSIAPITSRGRARSRSAPREPCSASSQVCPTPPCLASLGSTGRKSTRLNSSHLVISYAVFCLKKKNTKAARFSGPLR